MKEAHCNSVSVRSKRFKISNLSHTLIYVIGQCEFFAKAHARWKEFLGFTRVSGFTLFISLTGEKSSGSRASE